jgi:hypothetical protein
MPQKQTNSHFFRKDKSEFYHVNIMVIENVKWLLPEESNDKCDIICRKGSKM